RISSTKLPAVSVVSGFSRTSAIRLLSLHEYGEADERQAGDDAPHREGARTASGDRAIFQRRVEGVGHLRLRGESRCDGGEQQRPADAEGYTRTDRAADETSGEEQRHQPADDADAGEQPQPADLAIAGLPPQLEAQRALGALALFGQLI